MSASARRLAAMAWASAAVSAMLWVTSPNASATEPTASPWSSLSTTQQQALAPLRDDWIGLDNARRQKWIELANRMPRMPEAERERIQQRMTDWSRMSPGERGRARLAFQQSREFSAEERQARWQAYQALPEEERQRLAQLAKPAPKAASRPATKTATATGADSQLSAKRNIVAPTANTPVRTVAPSVVQAKPGATTNPVGKPLPPPSHTQPGLPKVAATSTFVDRNTLLPKRGAQAAAMAFAPGAQRQSGE
jgi:hypothetical protein